MRLLVLPCDGIGPEIVGAAMSVVETANGRFGLNLKYEYEEVGFTSLEKYGTTLRKDAMDLVVMREATEGFYPDRNMTRGWAEMMPSPDMALSVHKITRQCERPLRMFEGRKGRVRAGRTLA